MGAVQGIDAALWLPLQRLVQSFEVACQWVYLHICMQQASHATSEMRCHARHSELGFLKMMKKDLEQCTHNAYICKLAHLPVVMCAGVSVNG